MNPSNHLIFPDGGGLDLTEVTFSHELGCLELMFHGAVEIMKPKSLIFKSLNTKDEFEWSFFLLSAESLEKKCAESIDLGYEQVVELHPGHYVSYEGYDYGVYVNGHGEHELPDTARPVTRRVKEGWYLIIAKTSIYNFIPETYSGVHNKRIIDLF